MLFIPLQSVPSQTVTCALGGQNCRISIYAKSTGVFLDLYVSNTMLLAGVICLNYVRIVRDPYLGFPGDLSWYDMQGASDPTYEGIGDRYQLAYLSAAEVA